MIFSRNIAFSALPIMVFLLTVCSSQKEKQPTTNHHSLEYVMDMVHNNPGEKPYVTKYNNPKYIKSQGFTSMVTHWHINCAVHYPAIGKRQSVPTKEEKEWIDKQASWIERKLDSCEKYNIDVYPFTDFIVFPASIWQTYGDKITTSGKLHNLGGNASQSKKPDLQSDILQRLLIAQLDAIFDRFPQLDGLTLRFGETYLHDTPFHSGGSPIRDGDLGIQDHITLLTILREEVCIKRNKKIFYRTWDFGHRLHTNPEYYLKVTNAIEPHANLIFSIKYQQGDFHRMTPFNPCIGIGKHRQVVESQSRMEAYGKAAHPYYTGLGVIEGWPETKYEIDRVSNRFTQKVNQKARGLKDILQNQLLAGVMTWSNGGGWKGPYIKHEIWTDLNTFVVSKWAQNPNRTEEDIFYEFARQLGLQGYQADLFRQLNLLSIEGVRKGQLNSYTSNAVWWTRDQYFSVKMLENIIQNIHKQHLEKQILAEKAEASAIWRQIEAISKQIKVKNSTTQTAIEVSCTYGRIKYELIEQMWIMLLYEKEIAKENSKNLVANALKNYDDLWVEWKQLHESHPSCATIYTDMAFLDKGEGSIGEFVANLRLKLQ